MADEESLINDEYSVHLYRITSSTIADLMLSTVMDAIEGVTDSVHQAVKQVSKNDSTESIDAGCQKMKDLISDRTDSLQSRLRTFVCQTLSVPPHVLLPGDESYRDQKTISAKTRQEKEIHKMEKAIKNAMYVKAALSAELERGNQVLDRLQQTLECISSMEREIALTETDSNKLTELCEGIKYHLQVESNAADADLCSTNTK